jgi:hypothetical protein
MCSVCAVTVIFVQINNCMKVFHVNILFGVPVNNTCIQCHVCKHIDSYSVNFSYVFLCGPLFEFSLNLFVN